VPNVKHSNLLFELPFRATGWNKNNEIAVKLNWVWKRQFGGLKRKPVGKLSEKEKPFVRTQRSFRNIQSTQRNFVMKLKPIANPSGLTAQERFALLSATGRALLSMLAKYSEDVRINKSYGSYKV
jgi:hypothetical protein